jgi:hypothetical protein
LIQSSNQESNDLYNLKKLIQSLFKQSNDLNAPRVLDEILLIHGIIFYVIKPSAFFGF